MKKAVFHVELPFFEEEEEVEAGLRRPRAFSSTNSFSALMQVHAKLLITHIRALSQGGRGIETKKALERQVDKWNPAFMLAYRNKGASEKFRREMLRHIGLLDQYLKRTVDFYTKRIYKDSSKPLGELEWEATRARWLTRETRPLWEENLDNISKSLSLMVAGGNKFVIEATNPRFPREIADLRDAWKFHGLCTARYATALITKRMELYEGAKEACLDQAKQVGVILDSLIKNRIKP